MTTVAEETVDMTVAVTMIVAEDTRRLLVDRSIDVGRQSQVSKQEVFMCD